MAVRNAREANPGAVGIACTAQRAAGGHDFDRQGINGCITIKRINIPIYKYDNSVE